MTETLAQMEVSRISGKAFSTVQRLLGVLGVLVALLAIGTILPLVVQRFASSPGNAACLVLILAGFLFLGFHGLGRASATVSLDSDGLTYRTLRKRVQLGWDELRTARTNVSFAGIFYVAGESGRREIWVPCADSYIRQVVGAIRIKAEIEKKWVLLKK